MDRNVAAVEIQERSDGTSLAPAGQSTERWYEQLFKYIPGESISFYLAMEGVIRQGRMGRPDLWIWLLGCLAIGIAFTALYLRRIWKVRRNGQILISVIAFVCYVFSIGGVFREAPFYEPWQGTLVLILTTAFLAFAPPPRVVRASMGD